MEELKKLKSGIKGPDIITGGGLPRGRPSLICGAAGTVKTLFGIEFIVNGIKDFNEPGVIISFEERTRDLISDVSMLGWELQKHNADEFPFLITDTGFSILPVTEVSLDFEAQEERLLTGIEKLDDMFEGRGFYRGSSLLVCGTTGSGKTSLAAYISDAACRRGEKVMFISFEESKQQIIRNTTSIGIDMNLWIEKGLLCIENFLAVSFGFETNLIKIINNLEREKPSLIVIDLLEKPELAAGDQITAIPTLVRKLPEALVKIIGNLSKKEKVLVGLDLRTRS